MPTWLKIVLVLLLIFVGTCGLAIGGAAWWFNGHKGEFIANADAAKQAGEAFGLGHTDSECADEALRRVLSDSGFTSQVNGGIFADGCLKVAQRTSALCADAPAQGDILKVASWVEEACDARGQSGKQPCTQLFQTVARFCAANPLPDGDAVDEGLDGEDHPDDDEAEAMDGGQLDQPEDEAEPDEPPAPPPTPDRGHK